MAEQDPPRIDDTDNPRNPPNSVINPRVRSAAWWSFVAPLIALAVVVGLAFLYWSARGPGRSGEPNQMNPAVGTSGEQVPVTGGSLPTDRIPGGLDPSRGQEGGGDPGTRPRSTSEELEQRGVGEGSGLSAPGTTPAPTPDRP